MLPDADQVLHAFGRLSVSDGWKALASMLDLMVSRTPDDSSHFHALCARVRGISAEIPTPEATPPPTNGSFIGPQNLPEPPVSPQDADRLQSSGHTAGSPGFPLQQRTEPGLQPTSSSLSEHQGIHQNDQSQPAPKTAPDNQSQSATDTASGDQSKHATGEPPGPKPPPKKPPPFGEERFAKLNSDLRKESEPNPSLLFGKVYDFFQALRGTSPAQEKIDPSDPWRQQLRMHITNLEAKKTVEDGRVLYTTTAKRYRMYQFANEYVKDRTQMEKEAARKRAKRNRRKPPPKHPKEYTKPKEDHALVKLIRDCWGLHPSFVVTKDDWRRTKALYWLRVGIPMWGLVERMGYAAFIAPGLLLTNGRLKNVGVKRLDDFVDYVDKCYVDFKSELATIEPIIKQAMQSGCLEGPLLFIETLTPESKSVVNDFSLDHWLSRTPPTIWWPVQENTQPLLQDWPVQENGIDEHSARLQTPAPGGYLDLQGLPSGGNFDLEGLPPVGTLTEAEFEVQGGGLGGHSGRLQALALEGDFDQGLPPGETLAEAEFQAELNTFINTHASEET